MPFPTVTTIPSPLLFPGPGSEGPEPGITLSGERLYDSIPSVFAKDHEVGFFGRYFCEAIMEMLQNLDRIVEDSPTETDPISGDIAPGLPRHCGWSAITDPLVCPESWLDWCAALYGVTLTGNATADQKRAQIEELPPQKRGGIEAMRKAAEATLTGTKTVSILEQVESNSYLMLATTIVSETPDEGATAAALLSQKPAGVVLVYETGVTWEEATKKWSEVGTGVTWSNVKSGDV